MIRGSCTVALTLTFGFAFEAFADTTLNGQYALHLSAMYYSMESQSDEPIIEDEPSNAKSTETSRFTNLSAYRFFDRFCIGLRYLNDQRISKYSNKYGAAKVVQDWAGLGVSLGLMTNGGFFMIGNYYVNNYYKYKYNDDTKILNGGIAYSADIGYGFPLGQFRLGAQIQYLHFDYKDQTLNGKKASLDWDTSDSRFVPELTMFLLL